VQDAHRPPGLLHRAFSVLLVDPAGRLVLQQRAAGKTRCPLRWAHACCGHPAPGVDVVAAASQRLGEELGVTGVALTEIGVHVYRADDPATGLLEDEYDHVLVGVLPDDAPLRPDPNEVADVCRLAPAELADRLAAEPEAHAPWLAGVVAVLAAATVPLPSPIMDKSG
jgi:isopentenyl-diphosphate delta-isomerase